MLPGKKYTPEAVLQIAWRRKWLIIAPLVVIGLGGAAFARLLPNQYRSETLIVVVPQRVPENYVKPTVTAHVEDRLPSLSQQILSRTRLERIIQDFNLYPQLRRTGNIEDVVERMRTRDIAIQIIKGDSLRISYISDDARLAMQVTQRLASLFIDENMKDREILAQGTNQFLETQLQDARRRLIEHEKKLEEFRRQYGNELPTQLGSNLQAMNGTQMQLQAIVDSLNRDRDRRLVLERQSADLTMQMTPAPAKAVPAVGTVEQPGAQATTTVAQLAAARKLLVDLSQRLKPVHPDIARVERSIAYLERKAEAEAAAMAAAPMQVAAEPLDPQDFVRRAREIREETSTLDRQIAAKEAEQTRLKGVIADYERRVDAAPARESQLTELTRDYATLQTLYTDLMAKNEEAKISANLERRQSGEQFKVLDPARIPDTPISPNRRVVVLISAMAGLGLGAGLVALLEYCDTTLRTDQDVVKVLALPVLALVPVLRSDAERRRRRRRKLFFSVTSAATVLLSAVVALFFVWKVRL